MWRTMRRTMRRTIRRTLTAGLLAGMISPPLSATEVKIFSAQSQAAFLKGTLEGVSLDTRGRLRLADRVQALASVPDSLALSIAVHPKGWVVGGKGGEVLLVERQGRSTVMFTAPEPEIFALWADGDGTVFAGSSPNGKVYRITGGEGAEFFDPGETYIWALARDSEGDLLVATGAEAKLFEVDREGAGRLLYHSQESHLRSLLIDPKGETLVGTAGQGLVVGLVLSGRPQPHFSQQDSEVVSLALGPDGSYYAAVLPSDAKPQETPGLPGWGGPQVQATDALAGQAAATAAASAAASPSVPALSGAFSGTGQSQSKVVRIGPDGSIETLRQFSGESVYALLWARDRLWIGTGPAGRLYSYGADGLVVEQAVAQRQITALAPDRLGPVFLTNNSAGLYRLSAESERQGTFTSEPMDAQDVSRFGTFRWRGEAPEGSSVRFAFRTGLTATPGDTWSAWTQPRGGRQIELGELSPGRYVQWLAILRSGSEATPRLEGVEISYQQRNVRPLIKSLSVLDPGQILMPQAFNPSDQVYEPVHPNRDGIFTTLGAPQGSAGDDPQLSLLKQLWKKGFRSFRWSAEDPNGDRLVYDLFFTSDELGGAWLPVARDRRESYYNFDSTVLPDGIYHFRLVVSDRGANGAEEALEAEQVTESVIVDHSLPVLAGVEPQGDGLLVSVRDVWSPLRGAQYSVDASEWETAKPVEGLLDSAAEQFVLSVPQSSKLLLLRVTDAAWNTTTFDLSSEVRGRGVPTKP